MIVTIQGTLAGVKLNFPDKTKGQDFAPNQTVNVMQVKPDGDVEIVKIKDENMDRKYEAGKAFSCKADVSYWQNGSRSGVVVKMIEQIKAA